MILLNNPPTVPLRGELKTVNYNAAPGHTNFVDVLSISGSGGKLAYVVCKGTTTDITIKIKLDDKQSNDLVVTSGTAVFIMLDVSDQYFKLKETTDFESLMLEFNNILLIQAKQSTGTNALMVKVFYQDDS